MILAIIAQLAADVANPTSPLYTYGPMGIVLGWFMWRFERIFGEIRRLGHGFNGLENAILLEVSTRDSCPPVVRDAIKKKLAKRGVGVDE